MGKLGYENNYRVGQVNAQDAAVNNRVFGGVKDFKRKSALVAANNDIWKPLPQGQARGSDGQIYNNMVHYDKKPQDSSLSSPEREDFLKGAQSYHTQRYRSLANKGRQDQVFAGGVQGASRLHDDPSVRRAVTDRKARTRDFRLARRQAIRRGDRLGAAMIGEKAASQGFNLHGIGRYGEEQSAAARSLAGTHAAQAQKLQGLRGGYTGLGSSGTPAVTTGGNADGGKTGITDSTLENQSNSTIPTIGGGGGKMSADGDSFTWGTPSEDKPTVTFRPWEERSGQATGAIGVASDPINQNKLSQNIPTIGDRMKETGLDARGILAQMGKESLPDGRPLSGSLMTPLAPSSPVSPAGRGTFNLPSGSSSSIDTTSDNSFELFGNMDMETPASRRSAAQEAKSKASAAKSAAGRQAQKTATLGAAKGFVGAVQGTLDYLKGTKDRISPKDSASQTKMKSLEDQLEKADTMSDIQKIRREIDKLKTKS